MIGCWDACLEIDNPRIKIDRKTTKESTNVPQDTRYFSIRGRGGKRTLSSHL